MIRKRSAGLGTNITITLFRQGLGVAVALGLVALVARTLGPEGQGRYALAVFLPTVIVLLTNLGVPTANTYFLGRRDVSARAALATSVRLWALMSVVGLGAGAAVIQLASDRWFPGVGREVLWIALGAYPVALLHAYLVSLLQGLQDFNRYNVAMFSQPVSALVLTAAAVIALKWGIEGALAAYVFAWVLASTVAWWVLTPWLRRPESPEAAGEINRYARRCIGYGWKAQIAINMAFLSYRASTLLINYFLSPAATGVYVIAVAIAEKIWLLSQAASQVLLPRLSELHTDEERRRRLTPLATKIVFVMSAVIAIVLFAVSRPLIVGIFGDEFDGAVGALRWLLPGVVALAVARGVSIDLAARGRVDLNLYVAITVLAVNVGSSVLLIPRFGINGAAIATTSSYVLHLIIKFVIYQRISGNKWFDLVVWRRADYDVLVQKFESLRGNKR